ncbi:GGDEF domain-containing protein [Candidatus Daviesbacteria bacterium]|nr:GGDEF domain-containing protein [Candidatus Daviesbacteria bacterium]
MDQHKKYLLKHYQTLATKLLHQTITREEFAGKLTKTHLDLEKRADHDGLVKDFLNNQGFSQELEREMAHLKRLAQPGTLLALDIDQLKRFNDHLGHVAGDKLIKAYALVIDSASRTSDLKGRLGGDEFALFLVGANIDDAKDVAERIRTSITAQIAKNFPKFPWQQTISIGITQMKDGDGAESLRERADKALSEAKKERNKIVLK